MKKVVILLHFRMCFLPFPKDSMDMRPFFLLHNCPKKPRVRAKNADDFFGWHVCSKHWFQSALKQWNSCVSLKGVECGVLRQPLGEKLTMADISYQSSQWKYKRRGTPFQYTNKKDKLTNKFKSVIVRPRTRRKKVSEWFFVPLSASLPAFSFPSNWKAVLWKKWKHFHDGFIVVNLASKRRLKKGDDKRFFFYGPNFQK